ncbi:MAG: hypothetical protein U5R31_15860 [Acidimicrobiia bacterium]|nr:hypothetical protein [Acidimicrobiia bacterium]
MHQAAVDEGQTLGEVVVGDRPAAKHLARRGVDLPEGGPALEPGALQQPVVVEKEPLGEGPRVVGVLGQDLDRELVDRGGGGGGYGAVMRGGPVGSADARDSDEGDEGDERPRAAAAPPSGRRGSRAQYRPPGPRGLPGRFGVGPPPVGPSRQSGVDEGSSPSVR